MVKSNRKRRHRVKPVNEMVNYCLNILNFVAGEPGKSENEICRALKALNDKGLNYKRDALDTIHRLDKNHVLKISKSNSHPQRYEVELAPLGKELVTLWKSIDQSISTYEDLGGRIEKNFVVKNDISYGELKAKLLSKNWKLEDIPYHNQWLEVALNFMVKTLFVITLAMSKSYIRLLTKVKDNEPALAILNEVFSVALKRALITQVSNQEICMDNSLAQLEPPITNYFVEYCYNRDLNDNKFLEGKPHDLLNSIYSIVEPEKEMNINTLLEYIWTIKVKNALCTTKLVPSLTALA